MSRFKKEKVEKLREILYFSVVKEGSIHQKHQYTCQIMRNISHSCPLLVIKACKLLIPLSCRGIIVRDSVSLLKKSPINVLQQQHRHQTTWPFCIFAPSVQTGITSVAWFHLLHQDLVSEAKRFFGKYSPQNSSGFRFLHTSWFNHTFTKASANDKLWGHRQWRLTKCTCRPFLLPVWAPVGTRCRRVGNCGIYVKQIGGWGDESGSQPDKLFVL